VIPRTPATLRAASSYISLKVPVNFSLEGYESLASGYLHFVIGDDHVDSHRLDDISGNFRVATARSRLYLDVVNLARSIGDGLWAGIAARIRKTANADAEYPIR